MVLTNAQRQAQHRERLKARSTIMESLILRTRCDIREWKRSVALYASGCMHIGRNGVDCSTEQASMLMRMISENQALVDQYDPEGLIADEDVELGDVPPNLVSTLWRGRPVSYALDADGRAENLRLFDCESVATTDAAMIRGRLAGLIGDEAWSIKPATRCHHDVGFCVEQKINP